MGATRSKLLWLLAAALLLLGACRAEPERLVLATTTSTYDTGLLDAIVPLFEARYDADVDVVAVGTGEALALGAAGDADVVLVHARSREDQFVADGNGLDRRDVMCNDFVIVGPPSDPANVAGMTDAAAALAQIAAAQATFVSRGDDSGTHIREQQLWEAAGIAPSGDWYLSIGQGMGAALTLTDEVQAYTLSDRGTLIKRQADGLGLDIVVEGDERLLNPYGVIRVNPATHPGVNGELAEAFVDWLVSAETLTAIANFTVEGQPLFLTNPDNPADCMGAAR